MIYGERKENCKYLDAVCTIYKLLTSQSTQKKFKRKPAKGAFGGKKVKRGSPEILVLWLTIMKLKNLWVFVLMESQLQKI